MSSPKFRSAGQRGVRVGFRNETATARWPAAAAAISPAGQSSQAQELHARQPGRMGIRRIGADLPVATAARPASGRPAGPARRGPRAVRRRTGQHHRLRLRCPPSRWPARRRVSSKRPGSGRPRRQPPRRSRWPQGRHGLPARKGHQRMAPAWPVVPHRLPGEGGDRVIACVDLAVRDDPPVVLYPCGTPPAGLSPAIGPR